MEKEQGMGLAWALRMKKERTTVLVGPAHSLARAAGIAQRGSTAVTGMQRVAVAYLEKARSRRW